MKVSIRTNKLKKGYSYTVFIDYGIINGSRRRKPLETFAKKTDAENYKAKVQTEINNNTFIDIPDITFSEAIDEWMENYVAINCEPNTAASYETINNKYLKPCLGHLPLKIIASPNGIDIINEYYRYLRFDLSQETYETKSGEIKNKKNLSYDSLGHHKAQISGVFTYFVKKSKLPVNIAIRTVIPKTEDEKMKDVIIDDIENFEDNELYEDEEFITPEQALQVLQLFMYTDMMLPVFLAASLGLRRSEIAAILKSKVDIEKKKIVIDSSRVRCGNSTIFKKRNKNKTSTRILYMPQILIDIILLDQKRQEYNKEKYGNDYIESKFLCVQDNGKPLQLNYISKHFTAKIDEFVKRQTEIAKAEGRAFNFPKVTLHTLRHFNVSALIAYGAVVTDVKDNAGHSSLQTTMHYTHNYTEGKEEVANKVDEIFAPLLKNNN